MFIRLRLGFIEGLLTTNNQFTNDLLPTNSLNPQWIHGIRAGLGDV